MNTFSELSLSALLKSNLKLGNFVEPTPVQAQAIPAALAGRDIVATAQTGTGKTLAFVLPMLESLMVNPAGPGVSAVILTPTRELALQCRSIRAACHGDGIRSAASSAAHERKDPIERDPQGRAGSHRDAGRLCDYLKRNLVKLPRFAFLSSMK
jgi:superfamily II DNA/RNA helicase